jgi:hypothetical protein
MSNPLGEQDVIGNFVTCGDLFNVATKSNPVVAGSGLATTYVPGQVAFTANATSNTYQLPYAETVFVLVQLTSGTATVALNMGATSTALTQVAATASISTTGQTGFFYAMPSAAIGTALPGSPTTPFFNISVVTAGAQINNIAVLPVGFVPPGADWFSVRGGGINAIASGVVNTKDSAAFQPPTNLIGSGAFTPSSTVA